MASRSRAKSGTFFLSSQVDGGTTATGFQQAKIDISSFVNVLQGEVLRIKQIWFQWQDDSGGPIAAATVGANNELQQMHKLPLKVKQAEQTSQITQ